MAVLSILFGFLLGAAFGSAEDAVKEHLNRSAESVMTSVYDGDIGKKDAVVKKSWSYMKRAHLHAGAIGGAALGSIIVLFLLGSAGPVERSAAAAFGAGALLYSLFWLLAALKAPSLGSANDAKESLRFVAIPGAGLCILGVVGTLFSVVRSVVATSDDVS
jgi:hypothetical protein